MESDLNVQGIRDWQPLKLLRMFREVKALNLQSLFDIPDLWEAIKGIDIAELLELLDIPDASDKDAVREWIRVFNSVSAKLAKITPSELDDKIAAALNAMVESNDVYDHLFDIFDIQSDDESKPVVGCVNSAVGEKVGIDPVTILAIIGAVREVFMLLREWRDRRNAKGGA